MWLQSLGHHNSSTSLVLQGFRCSAPKSETGSGFKEPGPLKPLFVLLLGDSRAKTAFCPILTQLEKVQNVGTRPISSLLLMPRCKARRLLYCENVRQVPVEESGSNPTFHIQRRWPCWDFQGGSIQLLLCGHLWPLLLGGCLGSTLFQPRRKM